MDFSPILNITGLIVATISFVFGGIGGAADIVSFSIEAEASSDDVFDAHVFSAGAATSACAAAAAAVVDPGVADVIDCVIDSGDCAAQYEGVVGVDGGGGESGRGGAG